MPTPTDFSNFQFEAGETTNSQMSSDKASTPEAMAAETAKSQNDFANLQTFFNNSPYTAGSRVCHELDEQWEPPHPEKPGAGDTKTGVA